MKRILIIIVTVILPSLAFSKEVLFECGTNTENGFEGWSIRPYCSFEWIDFSDQKLTVYCEKGGDYTIAFQKKVDEMVGFTTIFLDLGMEVSKNCELNYLNVYFSMDGNSWDAIPKNVDEEVQITNGRMNYLFVKVVANVSFFTAGSLTFSHLKISGEYESDLEPKPEVKPIAHPDHPDNSFYIFSFDKRINVETQVEGEYEIFICNLAGQIVHQSMAEGSTVFDADHPDGIYLVMIVQKGEIMEKKKVVL